MGHIEYLHLTTMNAADILSVYQQHGQLLGQHLSFIFSMSFAALIFLFFTFRLAVMYYEEWSSTHVREKNECLILSDNSLSVEDIFNN